METLLMVVGMWIALAIGIAAHHSEQPQMDVLAAASYAVAIILGAIVIYLNKPHF